MLDDTFLKRVKGPIEEVWETIASDCSFISENEEAIEMCIDCDRIGITGDDVALDMIRAEVRDNGYEKTLMFLSKNINLDTGV